MLQSAKTMITNKKMDLKFVDNRDDEACIYMFVSCRKVR